jgi:hypothetical protein
VAGAAETPFREMAGSPDGKHAVDDHPLVVLDHLELDAERAGDGDPVDGRAPRLAEP